MNPRLRRTFIIIGAITILVIGIFVVPRGLSLYYQIKGGQQIEYVIRFEEGIQELVCEELPQTNEAARQEVEKGIADLNRAVRFNRHNAQAYYHLGKAHCLLGEPEEAKKNYLQYTELRPDNPLGYIGLGFAYEKLEDFVAVKNAWEAADLTVQDFNAAGDEVFEAERYADSIKWHDRAILINPDWANSWLGLGEAYDALGRPKEALEAYLEAWKLDPELSTAHLISAYQERWNFITVEELLEQMLEDFPNSSNRLFWYKELGDSYRGHGEYDQAIEIYTQAISEFPNKPNLHLTLGWVYFDQGENTQLAIHQFEKTIALDETIAEGYYGLARVHSSEKLYQEADSHFQEAIKRSPENRWYYLARGNNAISAGDPEHAIEIYQQVLEMYPYFAFGYYQLAQAYQMDDRSNEAIAAIRLALDYKDPPADDFYARAGNIYRAAGLHEKAIDAYRLALSMNPDNELAIKGMKLLEGE